MNKTTLTTLLLFTFFSLNLIAQETVYVSATGAGSMDGTSEANAYGNFGFALVDINSAGDKLIVIGTVAVGAANISDKNFAFTIEGKDATEVTRTVNVEGSSLSSFDGDSENLDVIMYPNPTSDKIHIKGLNNYDLKVYNMLGQIILKANKTQYIYVKSLPSGIYFVEVSDGVKSLTKRFVKY